MKTVEQQSLQSLQVSRKWFDKTITSLGNHMWALCYEFGATIAKSKVALRNRILALLDDEDIALPHATKRILGVLWEQYTTLSEQTNTFQFKLRLQPTTYQIHLTPSRIFHIFGKNNQTPCKKYTTQGD